MPLRIPFASRCLRRLPLLDRFLEEGIESALLPWCHGGADWLGWGAKRSARRARKYAGHSGGRAIQLDDGFLCSWGTGATHPPLSLVVDKLGIYYDSTTPSSLEEFLNSETDLLAGIAADVAYSKELLLKHRLSKYNHAPLFDQKQLRPDDIRRVLVVDQPVGDLSVALGGANAETFTAMVAAARAENPEATLYIKTHPEVSAGRKHGYLSHLQDDSRTVVLRNPLNPQSLIEHMDKVYVVSSTMGFEALMAGKSVTVFGLPWYAGWGVSDDRQQIPRRKRQRSVMELFAAAYFHYSRYLNPYTHNRGTIFDVIEWLLEQRAMAERYPGRLIVIGFPRWRRYQLRFLLATISSQLHFSRTYISAAKFSPGAGDTLLLWGNDLQAGTSALDRYSGARLVRMEDGFIRSVGLGSDLIPPCSLVLDGEGIYFDPTTITGLERILNTRNFSVEELERAEAVQHYILEHDVTKYNLEPSAVPNWTQDGREVVLVAGQVEDDASIRYGASGVRTNLDLLKAARKAHPDAFIVYKPHPDVVLGKRKGAVKVEDACACADHVETELSVISCINGSDVVHIMTSLCGFDALLRGKRVVVYGQPFYAGWGLTDDYMAGAEALARRKRQLSLHELIAGVLLCYPIYWDEVLRGFTRCESVLKQLVERRDELKNNGQLEKIRSGWLRRQLRKGTFLLRALLNNS